MSEASDQPNSGPASGLPASSLTVRKLERADNHRWDAFVRTSPQGTPFCLSSYLDALDVKRDILVAEANGAIEAGIVLSFNAAGFASNPLYVKHLGVLYAPFPGKTASRVSRERKAAAALMPELRRIRWFDYAFAPGFIDWLPFYWAGFAQETRYTYRIPATSSASWRDEADARLRNDLKRAEKSGLSFQPGIATTDLVRLVRQTYARQRAPAPFKDDTFQRTLDKLVAAGLAETAHVADASGAIAAAGMMVHDDRTAFLTVTGYAEAAASGATSLLIAGLIDRAHAENRDFDFEGSMIAPIEAFYRGFGGTLTPYLRIWRPGPLNTGKHVATAVAKKLLGYSR